MIVNRSAGKQRAVIVAVLFAAFVLLATIYTASHIDHVCEGENCPVCECLQKCQRVLEGIGAVTAPVIDFLFAIVLELVMKGFTLGLEAITPVAFKVRLND